MNVFTRIYFLILLAITPIWLFACTNPESETMEESPQGIDIGIKYLTMPEHPRGDFIPFSNCPQEGITKFEFRIENRGPEVDLSDKALFGSVQIKRLSDGALLLDEEAVMEIRAFTPGWVRFRFDPIDLSQAGLYEVTLESYLVHLPSYLEDKIARPLDRDLSDNKVEYLHKVLLPESLETQSRHAFSFDDIANLSELVTEGWNFSYLPDSVQITNQGVGGSSAIAVNLHQGDRNKRKLYTPALAIPENAQIEFQFKLLDAQSGTDVTEELIASEAFKVEIFVQEICATNMASRIDHSVRDAIATEDGFYKFPNVPFYQESGNYRAQIAVANLSSYPEITLVIDRVSIH